MKKLFALLVVLALCGAANAATISLVREGETIGMTAGGTITLEIETTSALWSMDTIYTVSGDATITAAMDPTTAGPPYGWDTTMFPVYPTGVPGKVVEIGGTLFMGEADGLVGFVTVTYGSGEVVISIAEGNNIGTNRDNTGQPGTVDFSQGVVTLIPEPMTIALLGLGGLFIRRRK